MRLTSPRALQSSGGLRGGTERLLGYNIGHVSILNARSRLLGKTRARKAARIFLMEANDRVG
jgi:hypothetical protein